MLRAFLAIERDVDSFLMRRRLPSAVRPGRRILRLFLRLIRHALMAAHRLELPLHPVANTFATGHRIRVDVASSSFPSYDMNPQPATNTIHHDAARPSYVELAVAAG